MSTPAHRFAPPSPPFIGATHHGGTQTPALTVIHATVTASTAGAARGVAHMWSSPSSPVTSAHYPVDEAEVIQCVGDHTVAYHCGYNQNSLAFEMCFMPLLSSLANWLLPKRLRPKRSKPKVKSHKRILPMAWLRPSVRRMFDRTAEVVAEAHLAYDIPIRYLSDAQLRAWAANGKRPADGGIVTHAQMTRVFKKSTHWDPGKWPSGRFIRRVHHHANLKREQARRAK